MCLLPWGSVSSTCKQGEGEGSLLEEAAEHHGHCKSLERDGLDMEKYIVDSLFRWAQAMQV